jgi:enoyl-CoA hydratase/carnithine racemase
MDYEAPDSLLLTQDGPVLTVTLNRPDERNALDEATKIALPQLWAAIDRARDVRAVVLTGAGKAFSAGGSLEDFEPYRVDFERRRQAMRDARRLAQEMLQLRVPIVAAVNGPAVGLGCTLVSLCDIVFIAESTYLADPHVAVALVAGDGGAISWPFMTSMLKVKQYLLTGDRVPAAEAVAIGLANFSVPAATVVADATAFAHRLASLPSQAVQDTKLVLNQHLLQAAAAVLPLGLATESQSHDTEDYRLVPERLAPRPDGGSPPPR